MAGAARTRTAAELDRRQATRSSMAEARAAGDQPCELPVDFVEVDSEEFRADPVGDERARTWSNGARASGP